MTKTIPRLVSVLAVAGLVAGCATEAKTLDPDQVEKQYGVSGAYNGSVPTPDGPMEGTIIPITLADGRTAQLVIPKRQASDARSVYLSTTTVCTQSSSKKTRPGRMSRARRPSSSGGPRPNAWPKNGRGRRKR
jgi:hypothetical protein